MAKPTKKSVRQWLLLLNARQVVNCSVDELEVQIGLAIPALIARFPAEAFCQGSVDAIATTDKFWSEAGTVKGLDAWCATNKASVSALPPEAENAPVSLAAKTWLAHFYRATDDFAASRALDLIRVQSAEAFVYLARHDDRAAGIVVRRRWALPMTRQELADDWDDEEGIRAKVRAIGRIGKPTRFGEMLQVVLVHNLTAAVRLHAPQHRLALADEMRALLDGRAAAASAPVTVAFPSADPFEMTDAIFGE